MSVQFELTLTKSGEPIIKFRHNDKSSELDHMALGRFIEKAMKGGLTIKNVGGFISTGHRSHENYEILVND